MRSQWRRLTSLLLLPLMLIEATGCTHVVQEQVPLTKTEPAKAEIVGVTSTSGREFAFEGVGQVRADTVYALVGKQPFQIPVDSVQRWWFRKSNPGATIGLVIGVGAVVALIAAAASYDPEPVQIDEGESCPFVYVWNGSGYELDAEPYGGAISQGLERDDFSLLPQLVEAAGVYRMLMVNEMDETQETNLAELWAVDHRDGVAVYPDEYGDLHTVVGAAGPTRAVTAGGEDVTRWLSANDGLIWEPLPPTPSASTRDTVLLTFPRPAGATHAKLVTRISTSIWGSYLVRAMLGLRGSQVDEWYHLVDTSTVAADSLRAWALSEGLYGLEVEALVAGEWTALGAIGGSGPYVPAARVVPLELPPATGATLELRLRPARGFWAMNEVAIDYSDDEPIQVDTIPLTSATTSSGLDVASALSAADASYYTMAVQGESAELVFPAPARRPGTARTMLLHTRGYYTLHLDPSEPVDTALVRRIETVPGTAAAYSAELFRRQQLATRETH